MASRERDDNIYNARLAEQGERYEDMIRFMKEVASVSQRMIIITGLRFFSLKDESLLVLFFSVALSQFEMEESMATCVSNLLTFFLFIDGSTVKRGEKLALRGLQELCWKP